MKHILIVDDEEAVCWALERALTKEGHRAAVASSAEDAFALAARQHFDAVILDVPCRGWMACPLGPHGTCGIWSSTNGNPRKTSDAGHTPDTVAYDLWHRFGGFCAIGIFATEVGKLAQMTNSAPGSELGVPFLLVGVVRHWCFPLDRLVHAHS